MTNPKSWFSTIESPEGNRSLQLVPANVPVQLRIPVELHDRIVSKAAWKGMQPSEYLESIVSESVAGEGY